MELHLSKPSTLSHYEALVWEAVQRVCHSLDEALDLQALAAPACMAPLHFHKVFRGLVGETPLQLHRRLRLERAACRLARHDATVLRIALDAGYETHEAFTRAFREAFGRTPSEQRAAARSAAQGAPSPAISRRLQAACGIHADADRVEIPAHPSQLFVHPGALTMNVTLEKRPAIRVAALPHTGPYPTIGAAFDRLGEIAGRAGLLADPSAQMIAIYYDDPETVPASQLRSAAGVTVSEGARVPAGLNEVCLPAGAWAAALHRGSYQGLGDAWERLLGQWLPRSGYRLAEGECYELYLNHPGNASEADLQTLLYVPVAGEAAPGE
ncbi:AraC family transcriptional regulator [Ideonella sp. DXS29W]|uniref:AraC family transcriptional regulator n=1 Tax=Ideonella lacteola TaxID=2984193 RepID=A0ABU9BRV2_9BURK